MSIGKYDGKPSVLIADDEEVIRDLFVELLTKQGYRVSMAIDGLDALHKIKEDNYDMLILDLKMPRMDGMEVLDKIREMNKNLIIIVITAYATLETAKKAIKQGCFDYIAKPFDAGDISSLIRSAFIMRKAFENNKKEVEVTERLVSLTQMAGVVVNEVNTVLTSTKLFLEMLRPGVIKGKKGKNIRLILSEIERAENLIATFLKFARPIRPEFFKHQY